MIQFKYSEDRAIWKALCAFLDNVGDGERFRHLNVNTLRKLRYALEAVDAVSIAIGCGDITITSLYRPHDKDSYHSKLQAGDVRSKDKPPRWLWSMERLGKILRENDDQIQLDMHKSLEESKHPNRHLHWEVDTGDIHAKT